MKKWLALITASLALLLSGCGYNTLQTTDEQVKSAWSEVLNQYQRRADLVPNLVETVKAFAAQERDVLTRVTEARSRVGAIQATPELVENPEAFAKFQAAQGELSGALSRLLAVVENYPQLKSDANFRDLQAQLEGPEGRFRSEDEMKLFLLALGLAWAQVAVPPLTARVTDLTGTLTREQQAGLERMLQEFEARKGSQLAVLLVPTTAPEAIEQFSLRVAEQWKVGRKKVDDGAILVVAKDDRAWRIEVGYGLEGVLNDATASRIIREVIVPRLREGDFYGGINAGLDRMMRLIDGEPLPEPARQTSSGEGAVMHLLPVLL